MGERLLLDQLANSEDWLSAGPTGPLDCGSAVLQFDLFGILDLPVLLLLVDAVAGYQLRGFLAAN